MAGRLPALQAGVGHGASGTPLQAGAVGGGQWPPLRRVRKGCMAGRLPALQAGAASPLSPDS